MFRTEPFQCYLFLGFLSADKSVENYIFFSKYAKSFDESSIFFFFFVSKYSENNILLCKSETQVYRDTFVLFRMKLVTQNNDNDVKNCKKYSVVNVRPRKNERLT